MKKIFFSLAVSLITILSADDGETAYMGRDSQMNQECPQKSCEPCCPKPTPPICCECYVPSYYDLQCNTGLFIYGDFLYWYAKEDNLSPCTTVQAVTNVVTSTTPTVVLANVKVNHLNTQWDPGFRVGLGYNLPHDGWDIEANYTWYHNKKSHVFSVPGFGSTTSNVFPTPGQLALIDPWVNTSVLSPSGTFVEVFPFDTVQSRWKLSFNQIDLDLGRKFWLSKYTAMRTYVGVRGGWFTTRFNNKGSANYNFASTFTFTNFSDQFKTKTWGVGLLAGIQPEWHFSRNFILFSNLDAALLWGRFNLRKTEDYTSFSASGVQSINFHASFPSVFYKMHPVLDIALGLRWEETWCYRIRTYLDIGWENHIWFDENHRFKYGSFFTNTISPGNAIGYSGYEELQGNLMMGGGFVRFRVDF
ncbi:MAG TPA: Lpg1974 family pore-forming outer membrane protein [Chlamydiales bacterium]|nr:Lpg1974 family pore-forming outer membrane protein [Chlamydiales bacterium]